MRGVVRAHDTAFLGIPYAHAPFGDYRFEAPQPIPFDPDYAALAFAATAPQPNRQFTLIPEPLIDPGNPAPACLSLNVFTPNPDPTAALPVFVFIHGGGFVAGSPSGPWYDGAAFSRHGVVTVSIGYRLGCEGFLAVDGAPANRAVLDVLAALDWVQTNIAAFGGDPAKVTVGGQSAGGGMATLIAAHPRGPSLVRGVIAMSGTAMRLAGPERAQRTREAIDAVAPDVRRLDPWKLVEMQDAARLNRRNSLVPTIDGTTVPTSLPDAIDAGATNSIRILAGATTQEGVGPARAAKLSKHDLDEALERMGLDRGGRKQFKALYPGYSNGGLRGQAATDSEFRVGPVRLAERRAAARAAPTYLYETDWRSPALDFIGAVHCVDVPFAFDCLADPYVSVMCGDAPPPSLADAIHGAFVRFITDGDPGWAAYDPAAERATMVFDTTSRVMHDQHGALRHLWP